MGLTASSRGDVLGAASLLLAILSVLFGLWYSEITGALRTEIPKHLEDAHPQRRQVTDALRSRALPLSISTLVLALIFLPEGVHIAVHWLRDVRGHGVWHAIRQYDAVSLSLVAVVVGMFAFVTYTGLLALRLCRLRKRLKPPG